jgi:hypothetical protein
MIVPPDYARKYFLLFDIPLSHSLLAPLDSVPWYVA